MTPEEELVDTLALFEKDPYGFVMWAFPWGEAGTELEAEDGPEEWQKELLQRIGQGLVSLEHAIRIARTSGHGIGKSTFVAWLILWSMSTREGTIGVVTANTETQLRTKTWVAVAKWHRLFIANELFDLTATALFGNSKKARKEWRFDMIPWSEHNTTAFQGLHNKGKRLVLIFDEASEIADGIWEAADGALTDKDTEIIWAAFGNPTSSTGRFRECFDGGRFCHRWDHDAIDSRSVRFTNHELFAEWAEDWGEDSDFFRVRVKGQFPRVDQTSFISRTLAQSAVDRADVEVYEDEPVILGVDVAREGDDLSVIFPRQGADAKTRPLEVYQGLRSTELAAKVAAAYYVYSATAIFVDEGGVGGGVYDRLLDLQLPVIGINFGAGPDEINVEEKGVKYANKRAEMWGAMRAWLQRGSVQNTIPGQTENLVDELCGPMYGYTTKKNYREGILLEKKADMKKRGIPSPNAADALALTFALPVNPAQQVHTPEDGHVEADYDPFTKENIYGLS